MELLLPRDDLPVGFWISWEESGAIGRSLGNCLENFCPCSGYFFVEVGDLLRKLVHVFVPAPPRQVSPQIVTDGALLSSSVSNLAARSEIISSLQF